MIFFGVISYILFFI